jgi:WD40 repeat protein
MKCKKKSKSEFGKMLLIQELSTTSTRPRSDNSDQQQPGSPLLSESSPLFSAKFSGDGNFLAVAGADGMVRVWKLLVEDTMALSQDNSKYSPPKMAAIFQQEPIQVFTGHNAAVLDLSWSKNNFLLSASMDRTVRLWHFSRNDCLGVFRHPDFVTSVAFHPRDDRVFVTGSLDCRLRLWSIADKAVRAWNELPANNFVTAVAFTNSGKLVLAGTTTGVCLVFETDVKRDGLYQVVNHLL